MPGKPYLRSNKTGRFAKGNRGGPGRPKEPRHRTQRIRDYLSFGALEDLIADLRSRLHELGDIPDDVADVGPEPEDPQDDDAPQL